MPQGYCDRGFAWKAAKQYDNAIADYSEAVRLNPADSDAYCGRGWAWREKQEFARALSDFGQALRIDPRDACALDGRAWIFATCPNPTYRDGKKAVEVAIEACELIALERGLLPRDAGRRLRRVGRFRRRRQMAEEGHRARDRPERKGRIPGAAQALPGEKAVPRRQVLIEPSSRAGHVRPSPIALSTTPPSKTGGRISHGGASGSK